jgi:hypothetical protein
MSVDFCELVPHGGYAAVMIEYRSYFDESGSHKGAPILCLAGFTIEQSKGQEMSERWSAMLDRFSLLAFHMAACANGAPPFDVLSMDERIEAEKEAISIIRDTIAYGFAVTVHPREFQSIVPMSPEIGSAYSLCAHMCLTGVRNWADRVSFNGAVRYVFEAGHKSQGEANGIMNRIFKSPKLRSEHRYAEHSFADKKLVLPLQAADIIAWQWFTENKRKLIGNRPPRKDFEELMRKPMESGANYLAVHLTERLLRDVSHPVLQDEYPMTYPWR